MLRAVPSAVRPLLFALRLGLLLALVGCGDLKDFCGTYRGNIVKGSFVRSCFAADVEATLRFNPDLAVASDAGALVPNTLDTSDRTFQDTPLEPVRGLANDHLSLLDFPGPQRLRNYVLLARPTAGPLAGRDAFVVVSLLASEDVEVRVTARAADGAAACVDGESMPGALPSEEPGEYFGLFRMRRVADHVCTRD
jgi:hypothetical protein